MALFGKATPSVRKQLIEMLNHVVQGTTGASGFALVPKDFAEKALKFEPTLLEVNTAIPPDYAGNVQVRATAAGIEAVNQNAGAAGAELASGNAAEAPATKTKPVFEIETGFAVPEARRGGIREATFPFETMPNGSSFFIAATADNPNPAKSMGSTVSSANKRYAKNYPLTVGKDKRPHPKAGQPTGKDGRKFVVRPRTVADGEKANGARVYRIA